MERKPKTDLTEQEWEWVIRDVFYNHEIDSTLDKIGMTRPEFSRYLKKNPAKNEEYEQAKMDAVPFLENDYANPKRKYDPKEAALRSQNLLKILQSRDPEKYGNKVDVNLNQNISIKANLENANNRLKELMRDVTPTQIPILKEEK